ncbi:MAG: hypothetical protein HRF47_06980, partial [Chloroflexota bacterium]
MSNTSKQKIDIRKTAALLLLLVMAGCNLPAASTPTPDLLATLQASTPLTGPTPALLATSSLTETPVILTVT